MNNRPSTIYTTDLAVGYKKGTNEKIILSGLDLSARAGEVIAILGANGTGKSTLLRTLAGLQSKLAGNIWVSNKNVQDLSPAQKARLMSIVLTDRVYPGYMSVADLVALGRHPYTDWRGRLVEQDKNATLDALSLTGLTELRKSDLHELSDGQLQKAMIARALAQDGPIMMLDEPLIHLDIPSKWEIMGILKQMSQHRSKTIILATHELELSLEIADWIWLITKNRELISGTPAEMIQNGAIAATFDSEHYKFRKD